MVGAQVGTAITRCVECWDRWTEANGSLAVRRPEKKKKWKIMKEELTRGFLIMRCVGVASNSGYGRAETSDQEPLLYNLK